MEDLSINDKNIKNDFSAWLKINTTTMISRISRNFFLGMVCFRELEFRTQTTSHELLGPEGLINRGFHSVVGN